MSIADRLPGMKPGHAARNILVGILYFGLVPFLILFVPLFYLPFAIATNRHNLSDRLSDSPLGAIPTIDNGGIQSAVTVFVAVLIIFSVFSALAPADTDSDIERDTEGTPNQGTEADQPTESETADSTAESSGDEADTTIDSDQTNSPRDDDTTGTTGGDDSTVENRESEGATGDSTSSDTQSGDDETPESQADDSTTTEDGSGDETPESQADDSTTTEDGSGDETTTEEETGDDSDDSTEDSTGSDTSSGGDNTGDSATDESDDTDDSPDELTVEVVDVVDGDTADIAYENGSTDTVRLLGVDTPEVHTDVSPGEFEGVPDTDAGQQCLRNYGEEASEFAKQRLSGKTVTLKFDAAADRRGIFDRLLGYLIVDGTNFNHELIANGYARVFDSPFSMSSDFYSAESEAQRSETGLWGCLSVETEDNSDESSGGALAISRIHEDAAGNDHDNLNDEFIIFENAGNNSLDLTGWTVEDEVGATYQFPTGFTLQPGDTVTLHTGSGSDSDDELYWGYGRAIWNNSGDTVLVSDDTGSVVIDRSY